MCCPHHVWVAGMEAMQASAAVDTGRQQPGASTSGSHNATESLRDAASITLCLQAVQSSCLLPFLDRQLENASFNNMASRLVSSVICFQRVGCMLFWFTNRKLHLFASALVFHVVSLLAPWQCGSAACAAYSCSHKTLVYCTRTPLV